MSETDIPEIGINIKLKEKLSFFVVNFGNMQNYLFFFKLYLLFKPFRQNISPVYESKPTKSYDEEKEDV